jgi:sugar lactone lactonase YvrE
MNKVLLLVAAMLVALLGVSGSALAATGFERVGSFNDAAPDGTNAHHQNRIAVNQVSGDIYVTDPVNDRVNVSHPNGTTADPLTSFGAGDVTDPFGIAIDQATGDVYVSDSTKVVKYASDGAATPTLTKDPTFTLSVTGPLAFDPVNDQLLVGDTAANVVRRYDPDGTSDGSLDGTAGTGSPGAFTGLQDLAVDSTGDIVIVDATGNPAHADGSVSRVERYASNGDWKATIGPVEQAATVAIRPQGDEVVVSGNQNTIYSGGTPTVHRFTSAGTELSQSTIDGALSYATVSGIAADDGAGGHLYVASDNADYYGGYTYGYVSVQIYSPFEIALPELTVADATPMQFGAKVGGTVDPNKDNTTWTFEYGKSTTYGSQEPASPQSAGAGDAAVPVAAAIIGLDPETTYHWRLTATNASGSSHTSDKTFTTGRAVATSNASDRAFEQVSPPDKGGQPVVLPVIFSTQARSDGDAVAYPSNGGFPGAEATVTPGYNIGRRTETGWTTDPVEAPQFNPQGLDLLPTQWFSDDFASTVQFSARALAPGAYEHGGNLYLRDNLTGTRSLMVGTADADGRFAGDFEGSPGGLGHNIGLGATPSLSHFAFTTKAALLPGVSSEPNVYEYADGQLRVVGVMPDGSLPVGGSQLGGEWGSTTATARPVSSDGRRVFFSSPFKLAQAPIYMRVDGQDTVPISVSHRAGGSPDPVAAAYIGASADGSIVYFAAKERLTDVDAAGVYRLDVETDELTLITPQEDFPGSGPDSGDPRYYGARQVSTDGSTVAFQMGKVLAPGAVEYASNEYVYRNGHITYLGDSFGDPNTLAMSPSGRYVTYVTRAPLTGYAGACPSRADPAGTCTEVYRSDLDAGVTTCVSCVPGRDGGSSLGSLQQIVSRHPSTRVLDDGTVLFESDAPLVSRDVNGSRDVYEFDGGTLRLVSSGRSPAASVLADASLDGRDVFFITSASLVGADTDTAHDLYDARRGGGIAAQNTPPVVNAPCVGDDCQGAPGDGPGALSSIGSVTFDGPGDAPAGSGDSAGKVTVSKVKAVRGVSTTIRAKVPGKGKIEVTGSGLARSSKTANDAGTYKLAVKLTPRAQRTLQRKHLVNVRVSVQFSPAVGSASTARVPVTFRSTVKKAAKSSSRSARRVTVLPSDARKGR